MTSKLTVPQWRAMVFASEAKKMTAAVKVLCLYLADNMDTRRQVRVPRKDIARALGIHEQRVAERFRSAVEAGFLVNVLPGCTGRTAVYEGSRPDLLEARDCVRQSGTQSDPENDEVCTDSRDTLRTAERYTVDDPAEREISEVCTAPLDASIPKRFPHVENRNGGNDEAVRQTAPTCRHGVEHGTEPDPWEAGALVCAACDRDQSEREAAL